VYDILNIILLILAIVIFLRLRNVLGRRTGHERPPFDPYSAGERAGNDNVVSLPGSTGSEEKSGTTPKEAAEADVAELDWGKLAPAGTPLAASLTAIRRADRTFEPKEFLDGARMAYEMIVTAFATGDSKSLRQLLSKSVFEGFANAITEREQRGERMESTFVGIDDADLVEASVKGKSAQITVKFKSQLISVTLDQDGEVVEGDPRQVRDVTDIWTFERDVTSSDPNWRLVATEAAH
jgi:predicted lipid-binding transport protein (Tim44 family)